MMNNKNYIKKNKDEMRDIIIKVLDKGGNYIIKSMPVNTHIKDILMDIKKCVTEGEFKNIVSIAIESSVNEGKEMLGIQDSDLESINKFVNTAFEGGLTKNLNIGVGTVENIKKYGNLFFNYIEDFFESLKGYIYSTDFEDKVNMGVVKCLNKVSEFKKICSNWYEAYDKFDINDISNIASKLNKLKGKVDFNDNCVSENTIIQNVTELVKQNNKKLTKNQFDICTNLEKI